MRFELKEGSRTTLASILLACSAFPGDGFACYTPNVPNEIERCAVVLANGLKAQGLDRTRVPLRYLEPVVVEQTAGDIAVIRREDGFTGETDSRLLKVYRRIGTDFIADRVRVGDIVDPHDPLAGNPLEAKVIVANTIDRLDRIEGGKEAANVISMRNRPDVGSEELARLDIFNVLTVHKDYVNRGETWYFVGRRGLNFAERDRVLMGWVRQADVILWPQRQAVYPTVGSEGIVFNDASLKTPTLRLDIQDDSDPKREFVIGKLPLISSRKNPSSFQVVVAAERTGQQTRKPDGVSTTVSTDDMRQRLWRLLSSIGKREVLFVIDNTESMDRYRQPVIEGILQFVKATKDSEDSRYAFAFYGDVFENSEESDALEWGRTRGSWTPRIRGEMKKRERFFQFALRNFGRFGEIPRTEDLAEFFGGIYDDPQNDIPEMGLAALDLAVTAANWQQERTVRVVVYIGDDGDRVGSVANVAQTLASNDITLISLNVAGRTVDGFNDRWLREVAQLQSAVQSRRTKEPTEALIFPPIKAYSQGGGSEIAVTRNQVAGNLSAFFVIGSQFGGLKPDVFVSSGDAVARAVDRIERSLAELNIASGNFFDDFLAARGLHSSAAVSKFYATNDTISVGYVPQREAGLYVAMTRTEFTSIYRAMQGVCAGMADSAAVEPTLRDVAVDLATTFLGEELQGARFAQGNTGETVSEFFGRLLSLPAQYFSVFGKRTVPDFIRYVRSEAGTEAFSEVHKEVCLSARLLQTILDGEYGSRTSFKYDGIDPRFNEPVFIATEPMKTFDWVWGPREPDGAIKGTVQASHFYFVPQEFFPQSVR